MRRLPGLTVGTLITFAACPRFSVGLTIEHAELSQANTAREWGKTLGPADKLYFLERLFGEFTVSRFFSPNLERLKQSMRDKAQAA